MTTIAFWTGRASMSFLIPLMLAVVVVGSWLIWPVIWSILTEGPADMIEETNEEAAPVGGVGKNHTKGQQMRKSNIRRSCSRGLLPNPLVPHPDRPYIWVRKNTLR